MLNLLPLSVGDVPVQVILGSPTTANTCPKHEKLVNMWKRAKNSLRRNRAALRIFSMNQVTYDNLTDRLLSRRPP